MADSRIKWDDNVGLGRSGWIGTVNGRRLFTIGMSISRRETWVLRTALPVEYRAGRDLDADPDVLKARAERTLTAFVTSLGAQFGTDA